MNKSLSYVLDKWDIDQKQDLPIELPDESRVTLAKLFAELGYRKGAEIGTGRGSFAITMSINNPGVKLYCVDSWSIYDGIHDYTTEMLSEYLAHALQRLKPYKEVEIINELK